MVIKTKSLLLKKTKSDDPELSGLIEDIDAASNLTESRIYSSEIPLTITFRIEKNKRLIGEVAFKNIKLINRKAELNIIIKKEYRNKGYAKEALSEMIEYGFRNLNFHRLEAEVYEYNKASMRLVENIGFVNEGELREAKYHNGKYHSIMRYGLLKNEWRKDKD
jgi:RimJ/RimL family protein N-acetyltransferase